MAPVTVRIKRAGENEDGVHCVILRRSDTDHDEVYHKDPYTGALVPGRPRRIRAIAAGLALAAILVAAANTPASANPFVGAVISRGAIGAAIGRSAIARTAPYWRAPVTIAPSFLYGGNAYSYQGGAHHHHYGNAYGYLGPGRCAWVCVNGYWVQRC